MKNIICISLIVAALLSAQTLEERLAERILRINEELLQGYTQPLINCFSTGISTGLFHSAYSHEFFGFDLGVRFMYINIPQSARTFDGAALLCSLTLDSLVYYEVQLESLSTVFGPGGDIVVPTTGNSIGIPSTIPAGFDRAYAPLIMPQVNIGLLFGAEFAIRYIPFIFQGSRMNFFGIGFKQEINKFPLFKQVPIPFALAFGAAYQKFDIETHDRTVIANSKTWNFQILASKRLGPFEPLIGVGIENTYANFRYIFEYEIPDTISGIPYEYMTVQQPVSVSLKSQSRYRTTVGCSFHMGFIFIHYDYNITPYATHNGMLGLSFR
jgi:hypothetical protein